MKHFAKILTLGAALVVSAPLAFAVPISGSIGFAGSGTYNSGTGAFVATDGANVLPAGTGTLSVFTRLNPATFFSFNSNTIPTGGEMVFTTTESGTTLTFTLTGFSAAGTDPAGPGFTGFGILSETNFDNTAGVFTLNSNSSAGTFTTFNNTVAATPEPSSLIMLGTGLVSAAGMLVRRRRVV